MNSKHLLVITYLLISITYLLATPPLESSDEYKHYPFVQYTQTQHKLPILTPDNPGRWLQEAAQPPLYYLLMAALTSPINTSDLPQIHHLNPHAFIGNPNQLHNKNLIIHNPQAETFPWQGTILAIYLIRITSIFLGLGTIWLTYTIGQTLFDPQIGLIAAAFTAFNPMFLFVSAAVNNDSLAILLGHAGLYWLIKTWRNPPPHTQWQHYITLGAILGLGILTKLSLGGLLALAGLTLALLAWQQRQWQLFWLAGPLVLTTATLTAVWWFIRNWQLYGNPTALNAFIAVQGSRPTPITWADWVSEFGTFYRTFWGLFGGVNILAPNPFYQLMNILALVGLIGLIKWLTNPKNRRYFWQSGTWLLFAWSILLLLLLLRWNIISPAFQGRLIFPALGGIYLLFAIGWRELWPRLTHTLLPHLFIALLAALLPWTTIRPSYALPQPLTAVPPIAQLTTPILFTSQNNTIALIGVTMPANQTLTPATNPLIITLYWQAQTPITTDYLSSVHLLGRDFTSVGAINRYPAWGMIPTSRWQPGDIYEDTYHIVADETAITPTQLQVAVSLYDPTTKRPLPATLYGTPLNPVLVGTTARLTTATPPTLPSHIQIQAQFTGGINLIGYQITPGNPTIPITLYWQATAPTPSQPYTIFLHLLDQNRQWIAGADAPPINNFYPTTLWQPGDLIDDQHHLTLPANLPPGTYPILVGLYDPTTGQRLPRQDSSADFAEFTLTLP